MPITYPTQDGKQERMHSVLQEVVKYLPNFTYEKCSDWSAVLRCGLATIVCTVTSDSTKDNVRIHFEPSTHIFEDGTSTGIWGWYSGNPRALHYTTITTNKKAELIAKQVTSKIIDFYLPEFNEKLAKYRLQQQKQKDTQELASKLAAVLGVETNPRNPDKFHYRDPLEHHFRIEAKVSSDGTVDLNIDNLSYQEAYQLLEEFA